MEHESDSDAYCNWCAWYFHERTGTGTAGLELEEEYRPSKLEHFKDQPEYWEESWWLEETSCLSKCIEKLSAKTGVETS